MFFKDVKSNSSINNFKLPSKQYFENDYLSEFKRHLNNNKTSNELEFLKQKITFIESAREAFEKLDARELTELEYKKFLNKTEGSENKKTQWIIERVDFKKVEIQEHIDACDFYLLEYKIRLARLQPNTNIPTISKSLFWNGTQTGLIELIKALIQNGNIQGTQKEIINSFENFLNIKINNPNKLISDLSIRNNGSETLFLDELSNSLKEYIQLDNKRK